jgi:DHA1 family bicyclomycin/chloramphenicol resistance-like MFS transporter
MKGSPQQFPLPAGSQTSSGPPKVTTLPTSQQSPDPPSRPLPASTGSPLPLSNLEFVTLAALLTCLTALSIDIMLPVLPDLAEALGVVRDNDRQWVVTSYLIGLVLGQLVAGGISDRSGRLPVLFAGLVLFTIGAALASAAQSFSWLLAARFLQGLGGAAPRVVVVAVVRDLYEGRQMARVMSLVMTTFILVPVIAPSLGQILGFIGGWRAPIYVLALVGIIAFAWAWLRLPETSPRHRGTRRGPSPGARHVVRIDGGPPPGSKPVGFLNALRVVLTTPVSLAYIVGNGFMFACLMSYILSSQQVFVDVYGLGAWFPIAFGSVAMSMAAAGLTNSQIVMRYGMRTVSHRALLVFATVACLIAVVSFSYGGRPPLALLWIGLVILFFFFGLVVSNFNAIAMEPLGDVAGTASSLMGSYTTLSGALFGTLVGQFFDQTALPLGIGFVVFSLSALFLITATEGVDRFARSERG